jgi:pentose-5-phosphate-3-epimerase
VNLLSTDPLENNGEFIASTISKLESGYNTYSKEKLEWVVDGGVTNENISSIISSHANIVVIGRYLFEGCIDEKISQMNRVVEKIQFSRV